jgi:hypothetical protein
VRLRPLGHLSVKLLADYSIVLSFATKISKKRHNLYNKLNLHAIIVIQRYLRCALLICLSISGFVFFSPDRGFFLFWFNKEKIMDKKYVPEKKKRCRSANRVGRFCRY